MTKSGIIQARTVPAPFKGKYRLIPESETIFQSDKGTKFQITSFVGKSNKAPRLQIFVVSHDNSKTRVSGLFSTQTKGLYKFDRITATGKIGYFLKLDEDGRGFQVWEI